MKKRFKTLLVTMLLLALLSACATSAPSQTDVSNQCQQENLQPGETVTVSKASYPCPIQTVTPTPRTNIANLLLRTLETACAQNNAVWQDPSNAEWLAEQVIEPATSWKYQNERWVYTYAPEVIISGVFQDYATSFHYPGFGTFIVTLYEGGTTTVNTSNQPTLMWFTRLELSCP